VSLASLPSDGCKSNSPFPSGLSALGFLLVWLFVPATDYVSYTYLLSPPSAASAVRPELIAGKQAMTLEDMSAKFNSSLRKHGQKKLGALKLGMSGKESPGAVSGAEDGTADETVDGAEENGTSD